MGADHLRTERIHDARTGIASVVARDERLVLNSENSFHRPRLRFLERIVDRLRRRIFFENDDEVRETDRWGWYTHGEAVQFSSKFWQHESHCLGRSGRCRDQVLCGTAGTAPVFVGEIEDTLVVR